MYRCPPHTLRKGILQYNDTWAERLPGEYSSRRGREQILPGICAAEVNFLASAAPETLLSSLMWVCKVAPSDQGNPNSPLGLALLPLSSTFTAHW